MLWMRGAALSLPRNVRKVFDGKEGICRQPGSCRRSQEDRQCDGLLLRGSYQKAEKEKQPHVRQTVKGWLMGHKKEKKEKTPTYNMTLEQIEGIKRAAVKEAINEALILLFGLPVMVLRDKHGFDDEETDKFVDGVTDLYDSYEKGYITLKDVEQALQEEAGVNFERELRGK
ncbi:MAG: hypothetical protein IKL99_03960 [Oscillospiraceae bacterium]|nr:hypothetical protein [Oscillospiraceae bacterium]